MTDNPNIKREILNYCIEQYASGEQTANLRDFAAERGYSEQRVADHANQLYPAINCGVSSMLQWAWERDGVAEFYEQWDVEPPEAVEEVDWVDE